MLLGYFETPTRNGMRQGARGPDHTIKHDGMSVPQGGFTINMDNYYSPA